MRPLRGRREMEIVMWEKHRVLLGAMHLALGGTVLYAAMIVAVVFSILSGVPEIERSNEILGSIGVMVFSLLAFISLPGIISGLAILLRASWSKPAAVVVGVLNLASVPLGTIVGLFTLYVAWMDSEEKSGTGSEAE